MTQQECLNEAELIGKYEELVRLYTEGRFTTVAVECFNLVNSGWSEVPDIWHLRGLACFRIHQFVGAANCFEQAININNQNIDYYISIAQAYSTLRDDAKAAHYYEKAIFISEDEDEKLLLSKKCLYHLSESEKEYPKNTAFSEFFESLTFEESDELLNCYEQGESLSELAEKYSVLLGCTISAEQVRNTILIAYIEEGNGDKCYELTKKFLQNSPSEYLHNILIRCLCKSIPDADQEIFNECKTWGEMWARPKPSEITKFHFDCSINSKSDIHVAFVADFMGSNYGKVAMFPLAETLAKTGINVTFYNMERSRYTSELANFTIRNVFGENLDVIHNRIVEDRVTILLDANGRYRDKYTYDLIIRRSAPIQIVYMNAVCTSGVENFDFIIGHHTGIPVSIEHLFTERVIRLPCNVSTAYEFERDIPISTAPCLKNGYVTFGCFTSAFKLNKMLIGMWAEILLRVPSAVLYLKCRQITKLRVAKRVVKLFKAHGIPANRLILEGFSWVPFMRQCLNEVDICLDTYPQSAGSTNQHSIWQGVPVITLSEENFRSSITASLLENLGQGDLITHSRAEYISKAVSLAGSFGEIQRLREEIANSLDKCPDFKPDVVYNELSDKFLEICKNIQAGVLV